MMSHSKAHESKSRTAHFYTLDFVRNSEMIIDYRIN